MDHSLFDYKKKLSLCCHGNGSLICIKRMMRKRQETKWSRRLIIKSANAACAVSIRANHSLSTRLGHSFMMLHASTWFDACLQGTQQAILFHWKEIQEIEAIALKQMGATPFWGLDQLIASIPNLFHQRRVTDDLITRSQVFHSQCSLIWFAFSMNIHDKILERMYPSDTSRGSLRAHPRFH